MRASADVRPDVRVLSLPVALAVAVASGAVLWAAFPGVDAWPAAPLAVLGLALATRGQRARRAALVGFVGGMAFMVPHLRWSGIYVGVLPWMALAVAESAYLAAMGALMPRAWRAPGGAAGAVTAISGLWVAQEALRGRTPFGGFPWARLAFSQSDSPLLGFAALGGAPLVTGAVAAVGAALAVALAPLLDARTPALPGTAETALSAGTAGTAGAARVLRRLRAVATRRAGALVAVAAALLLGGAVVPRPVASTRSVQVAAVQGSVPTAGLEFNAQRRAVLDNHARATVALGRQVAAGRAPRPDVVLWPENSSDIDPFRNDDAAAVISAAADAVDAPLLVGAVLQEPVGFLSNAGILWRPSSSGRPGPDDDFYVKRHPAPFAEYIPYRSFFRMFSDKVDLVTRDFLPGRTVGVLPAGGARLGDIICFEVAYDDLVRDTVTAGADLLVVQTNNATFGYSAESVQQLAMSRLRAVETGRAVVHVSTVGVSGLIMPDGHLTSRSDHFATQVLQGRLPLRTGLTVATRVGAAPEIALAAAGVVLAALAGGAGRRGRWAARWQAGWSARRRSSTTASTSPSTAPGDAGKAGQESRQ